MKIEKRPGHDWIVTYRWEDERPDYMGVFGAMTAEQALDDARFSLGSSRSEYEILAVVRVDQAA